MALPTTTHLTITGIGIVSAGGLAYGGYFVFKDNPRPVTELLKGKNRVFLKDDGKDESTGTNNGQEYVKAHKKIVTVTDPAEPQTPSAPRGPSPQRQKTEEVFDEKDIGELVDGKEQQTKTDKAPASFKEKCKGYESEKLPGIGSDEYQKVEKYCTKVAPTEDS